MTKEELYRLRNMFPELKQDEISILFGFGTKTFNKYMTGRYRPTTAHIRYMRLVLYMPEADKWLRYVQGRKIDTGKEPRPM